MKRYIISIRRERIADAPAEWTEPMRHIQGLRIRGSAGGRRVQVDATDTAIAEVRRLLSDLCHIEPVVVHRFV